ncbi:MAG: Fe-S cluster assembly protein SufD [Sulfobacillus acidophilus]|uniref:Fe-S cluster assembly protein SufD n=1 Tax=Sulfobacillus acidophilus TaxID=53633 RepID=A0A2T2WPG2_9FIRM|nr:MAG: Fe-S cluster assembly protein SufD [Sulfobacillus acidophilus]
MNSTAAISSQTELHALIRDRFGHEPDWSLSRRLRAATNWFALDWPRLERTPLQKRRLDAIAVYDQPPADGETQFINTGGLEMHLHNNVPVVRSIPEPWIQRGVIFQSLRDALDNSLVRQYLGSLLAEDSDKIAALNAALWQNGVFLYVPPGISETVEVVIQNYATSEVQALLSRNVVVVGAQSRVAITERWFNAGAAHKMLLAANTEIIVEHGAEVQYGAIQQCEKNAEAFIHRAASVAGDARLDWHIGEFGAGLIVSSHQSHLNQAGASTKSITVFFGSGQQHQDYTGKSVHHAPHTTSDMTARGVMKGKARSIFTGVTQIDKGARGSDGRQREQTLMLTDDARADAIPSLVIDEQDVYAAHAASAGPVDRTAIFYLTSRGLTEEEATRLIVHGFLAPVIDAISQSALRDEVWQAVERKIRE